MFNSNTTGTSGVRFDNCSYEFHFLITIIKSFTVVSMFLCVILIEKGQNIGIWLRNVRKIFWAEIQNWKLLQKTSVFSKVAGTILTSKRKEDAR